MKLFISVDIEGVAGIVNWDQVMPGSADYRLGQRLLVGELNALCNAAFSAGATEITVNDSHGPMRNLPPDEIDARVRLIAGHFKPGYMMEGLDASFDGAVFLGYHGAVGTSSVLSHTYNPRVVYEARLDGQVTGETGINALVAHDLGVPVVMITGDATTVVDARHWIPEATGIEVKRSISRFSADSLSPSSACALIADSVAEAMNSARTWTPPESGRHRLELSFQSADMAYLAEWVGAERIGPRSVEIGAESGVQLYRTFHAALLLARAVIDG